MSKNTPAKKSEDSKGKTTATKTATPFWKKHFLKLFLVLLLIVSVIWGWVANNQLQKEHKKEITELNEAHDQAIQKLYKLKNKEIAQTLALAVRSELIDENKDQVNQYFLQIIKQPSVEKVMLIDHNSGKITLSTNKKDEGSNFDDAKLFKTKDVITVKKDGNWYTATPIMGLNNQLAVIVIVSTTK